MTISIIHELDINQLERSIAFLESEVFADEKLEAIHISEFINKAQAKKIITLHLDLNNEIANHQRVSEIAQSQGIVDLNPFNESIDNKYLFNQLMLANDIKQAKTILIKQNTEMNFNSINGNKLVIKANHGTESRDLKIFSKDQEDQIKQHIAKIHDYDDALIQEFIEHKKEYRILAANNKLFSAEQVTAELVSLATELLSILQTDFVAFDILETNDEYYVLEANSRPAAMHQSINLMMH